MEKHNPSSFTVDSSSPAHRSSFAVHDLAPYINWIYFFHAWGFQPRYAAIANIHGCDSCRAVWLTTFPEEERGKASEAMQLYKEANRMLNELDRDFEVKTIFKLCPANADGDNLIIDGITFPLLRQQVKKKENEPFLCLSDFVRPLSSGITDVVGAFASSIDADMEGLYEKDPYKHLLVQTLSDRLAEAAQARGADVALFGHTHHRTLVYDKVPDVPTLFNPGSLRDEGCYGVITVRDGRCSYEWKNVPQ